MSTPGEKIDLTLEGGVHHVKREVAVAQGKALRRVAPRTQQAQWKVPSPSEDPIEILAEQAQSREPDLVPIRHGRMMVSPFTFYRGAAAIMAADLAATAASGLRVQLCGDAHLLNFEGYASPERDLVFDVNDFDETLPGPWEWDVKRLATSIEVAARDSRMSRVDRRSMPPDRRHLLEQYRVVDMAHKVVGVWAASVPAAATSSWAGFALPIWTSDNVTSTYVSSGTEGIRRHRHTHFSQPGQLRSHLRLDPGPGPRPIR